MSNITQATTSSIFKVLDNRIVRLLKENSKATINANLIYKAGSDLMPIKIAKISH